MILIKISQKLQPPIPILKQIPKKNIIIKNTDNNKNKKISIVMACYNRKRQLDITLKTIENLVVKNVEIIIVDDASDDDQQIDELIKEYKLDIKLIKINKNEKNHVNPCVPYNIGFRNATGEIIVIQNPEVCHVGDVLKSVVDNLYENDYLNFPCYGLSNIDENDIIRKSLSDIKNIRKFIISKGKKIGGSSFQNGENEVGGWLNHGDSLFHYLIAMYRKDLDEKLNGGFDGDYANGLCYDDNDFVRRAVKNNFIFKWVNFDNNNPFGIHLWHEKAKQMYDKDRYTRNQNLFIQKMKKINMENMKPIKKIII